MVELPLVTRQLHTFKRPKTQPQSLFAASLLIFATTISNSAAATDFRGITGLVTLVCRHQARKGGNNSITQVKPSP